MKRALLALAIAMSVLVPITVSVASPGFETGSCKYPAGRALPGSGAVREVPGQYATIQDAVDAAAEGDTVLIAAGTYNETVTVSTPGLRIHGASRSGTVLDGQSTLGVGILVTADRVVLENMTGHNYTQHAFHWFDVTGYWGRYLTAYNNGLYGVFALGSRCGQFDHSYGSGNADSAFYIGQCWPCDTRIQQVDAEENGLGYSGTNAGGNLVIRDSIWNNNALGIVPNSLDSEERPPQRGLTIANNDISYNNGVDVPGVGIQANFYGVGIAVAGGNDNSIYGNTVRENGVAGIVLVPLPSNTVYIPSGNTVWGNVVTHDATAYPDAYDLAQGAGSGPNNCWADNVFGNSGPEMIETIWSCGVTATPPGGDPRVEVQLVEGEAGLNDREASPWQTWPAPTCTTATTPDGTVVGPCIEQSYSGGAVEAWLPGLGL